MGFLLLFLFIAVPLIEIALFIQVGDLIGLWPTLAIVVITAVLGSWQLRVQGFAAMSRARSQMDQGQLPAKELFDGFCLLLAGMLLLTPGFFTDTLGFLLFLAPVRNFLRSYLSQRMTTQMHMQGSPMGRGSAGQSGGFYFSQGGYGGAGGARPSSDGQGPTRAGQQPGHSPFGQQGGPTIDGDFQDLSQSSQQENQPGSANQNSPWRKEGEADTLEDQSSPTQNTPNSQKDG